MDKIDEFFFDTEKVSFLDINSGSYKGIKTNISYPIDTKILIEGLKDAEFNESLSIDYLIDGIIMLLAIDPDFIYKEDYLESLKLILGDISPYVLAKGSELEISDKDKSIYYYRFLNKHGLSTSYSNYRYAMGLYNLYLDIQEDFFKKEAVRILESIISSNPEFPLSYYELGRINSQDENFNKAYLYLQKALERVEDPLVKDELREEIRQIYPNALVERGLEKLYRNNMAGALDDFKDAKVISNTPLTNCYLGVTNESMGNLDIAIDYYNKALEMGGNFRQLYQDLAIAYFKKDQPLKSLEILTKGLQIHKEDLHLLYNRMVININLDRMPKAKEDYETIIQYGDIPEEIYQNTQIIKQEYGF